MSKKLLALGAITLAVLAGCEQSPYPDEEQAYVDEQAGSATRQQMAAESEDLQKALRELQSKDPSVKDVYYSFNERGERVMHIVREEANGQSNVSVWPVLGGMAAGALGAYAMSQMMNNSGGYQNYQRSHTPYSSQQLTPKEEKERRNSYGSYYASSVMNTNRNAVRNSPNFQSNMNTRVNQWRASPNSAPATVQAANTSRIKAAMAARASARATSHGNGG